MLSCQSPMPAGAGTPRYEKPELWLGTANWHGGCHAPPRPPRGTSPRLLRRATPSTFGLQIGRFAGGEPIEVDWRAHPGDKLSYQSPCRLAPAHQGIKSGSCGLVRELARRYIFSFRHRPSVYNLARFAGGEPASRLIGGHIPDRSPGHAFVPIAHAGWRRHTKVSK